MYREPRLSITSHISSIHYIRGTLNVHEKRTGKQETDMIGLNVISEDNIDEASILEPQVCSGTCPSTARYSTSDNRYLIEQSLRLNIEYSNMYRSIIILQSSRVIS